MLIRSILFNILFYLNTLVYMTIALPTFFMPYRAIIRVAQSWGRTNLVLLRLVCGIKVEIRGLNKIPKGALIVASKHQSAWETFALLTLFDDPLFILKRELIWIPVFGWLLWKGRMISVHRGAGSVTLASMTDQARIALAAGRQIIIFPEGTRRPAGAKPNYKFGVAHLYATTNTPCLPITLNSGLFWPRRTIRRVKGTVLVEILDPIAPGLERDVFFAQMQEKMEAATVRLIAEGQQQIARGSD